MFSLIKISFLPFHLLINLPLMHPNKCYYVIAYNICEVRYYPNYKTILGTNAFSSQSFVCVDTVHSIRSINRNINLQCY